MNCGRCGYANFASVEFCSKCGASLTEEREQSDGGVAPSDTGLRGTAASEYSRTSGVSCADWRKSSQPDSRDESLFSMAVNIRRIFVVLLTFLALWTISLSVTLYLSVSDDPSSGLLMSAIVVAVLVALVGIIYAIRSKRLST